MKLASKKTSLCRPESIPGCYSPTMDDFVRSSRDVIVRTPDLKAAAEFYQQVMGLTVTQRTGHIIGFETGALQLFVEQGDALPAVLDFLVPDVRATKAVLVAAGCTIVEENPNVPRCYMRDPFGLLFNLGER
jgi:catechol 2,3-dioxygenase-like lactoylglutathione lyase family enzyme